MIRQPIVTICGHVDHGKTSLLDSIRGTKVAEKEAGRITQKISFTLFPAENLKKGCYLLDKHDIAVKIPGFLFIDTPGHAAFTNLRKRGGSLADLAIVVVDINEGLMPQTSEVLSILKQNKTPFIVALNKIDNISGWRKFDDDIKQNIESQAQHIKDNFQEKLYTIIAALESHGFKSDLFYEVDDYTKKVCLVPISAKTKEGLPELLMILCGISQKFLSSQLSLGEKAKGVIFEIKKEKAFSYIQAIIYDGKLKQGDEIAIASFHKPIISKIRVLERVCPLCDKFENVKEASAAIGLRMQLTNSDGILPGMPFQIFNDNLEEIEKEFKKDLSTIETEEQGIIVKADSLGSLEALLILLRQASISVLRAGIGSINKQDITSAKTNLENNPENAVVLGFNVALEQEIAQQELGKAKLITDDVVYKLIENLQEFQKLKRAEILKEKMMGLASICKLEILTSYVFRNSNPAIFGVKVLGGKLKSGLPLIDDLGEEIARVKAIQSEKNSVNEASQGMEVAISLSGTTFDRQLKNSRFLYANISERQFKEFKKNKELLSSEEISILQEIAQIKKFF